MMALARRTWLLGAFLVSGVAMITCSPFSSGNDGDPGRDDGGSAGADAVGPGTDGGGPSMPDAADAAVRWCDDGGHAFCADFDNLGAAASPVTGWTDAVRDSVGSTLMLTQSETVSAPSAARLALPRAAGTEIFFRETTEAGAPITTATLTFAIRPKIGALIPDAGDPVYTIGSLKIRDANGNELGSADLDWASQEVRMVTWKGNGGAVNGVWTRAAGTLAIDDWIVVTIVLDVANHFSTAKIQDLNGLSLGESKANNFDWGDARSVTFELGVWQRNEVRPDLTVTLDNVALDITH